MFTITTEGRAEDLLVVPREPSGQVDVEVGPSVGGVARGHVGERAAPTVEREHEHLQEHQTGQRDHSEKSLLLRQDRDPEDARDEERPRGGVRELHEAKAGLGGQSAPRCAVGFARTLQGRPRVVTPHTITLSQPRSASHPVERVVERSPLCSALVAKARVGARATARRPSGPERA